ncbi:MAG: arylsulfatase, partial [Rhodobacteraceae bacterium]|nr:arylsulfatase [Paracoccaceae bacterium]
MTFRLLPFFILGLLHQALSKENRPNIIFVLADDLGWAELGCYGNTFHETPHLDQLAKEGVRFTHAYAAAPVCSPYRAALLTGQHPARVGILDYLRPNSSNALPVSQVTLPKMLRHNGYSTGMVGKWHLGHHPEFLPTRQGFDSYFGIPYSNDMSHPVGVKRPMYGLWDKYWKDLNSNDLWHTPLIRNEKIIEHPVDQHTITRRYTDEAISFIQKSTKAKKPFFLYLAH